MNNREIKFRAWDGIKMLDNPKFEFFNHGKNGRAVMMANEDENVTIMQFTGLKDKNGKEIYEGDILKWTHPDFKELKKEYKILEMKDIRKSLLIEPDCNKGWIKVIGNIYENPELLK